MRNREQRLKEIDAAIDHLLLTVSKWRVPVAQVNTKWLRDSEKAVRGARKRLKNLLCPE